MDCIYWRFSNHWPLKALLQYCLTFDHSFTHSHTDGGVSQAGRASWSGAVRVRSLAQGTLRHSGAGVRTSNLPVTSQPTLPS